MAKTNCTDECPSCYICGCARTGSHPISMRQNSQSGSYFPFLETHEPPNDSRPPTSDGVVLACYVCFSYLNQQWECYEKSKVPLVKRIYWLKRVDGGPYTGVEMGMQSEYASQVFGLTTEMSCANDVKRVNTVGLISKATTSKTKSPSMEVPLTGKNCNDMFMGKLEKCLPVLPANSLKEEAQVEALDLSVDGFKKRKYKISSRSEKCRKLNNQQNEEDESADTEVLDLSMPDKNATTEVCYVCGKQFVKGSLVNISAKPSDGKSPFFPNLMYHARPRGSRPMEPSGKVLSCNNCSAHLLMQWKNYEDKNVSPQNRPYSLASLPLNSIACERCGHVGPVSSMKTIPNAIKHLLSFLRPSNDQNYFCPNCFKFLSDKKFLNLGQDSDNNPKNGSSFFPLSSFTLSKQRATGSSEMEVDSTPPPENSVTCCLCQQIFSLKQIQTLSMVNDPSKPNNMFFSFLKYLPQINQDNITDDGCILSCKACYSHLKCQWLEFEKNGISEDQRHFTLRNVGSISNSPRPVVWAQSHSSPQLSPQSSILSGASPPLASNFKSSRIESPRTACSDKSQGQSLKEIEISDNIDSSLVLPSITNQKALNTKCNCFLCCFPSKAACTYSISSEAKDQEMFFPFLKELRSSDQSENDLGNDTFLVCTICFHSLVVQWQQYKNNKVEFKDRVYDTYNFTCYICSTKTYRKRLCILHVKVSYYSSVVAVS